MEGLVQTANCNLGMTLVKMGDNQKAKENFIQAVKGSSEKIIIKSLYWMIKCDIGLGNFDKAH